MPSASSEAAREPSRSGKRASPPGGERGPARTGSRRQVVIRLPALPFDGVEIATEPAALPAEIPTSDRSYDHAEPQERAAQFDSDPSDPIAPAPIAKADMTTFAIPNHASEPTLPEVASEPETITIVHAEPAAPSVVRNRQAPAPGGVAAAWGLIRKGHAFVMQPKVWLACVLGCFAVLLTVFVLTPPAESFDSPQSAVNKPLLKQPAEPAAEATRIVAPPAEIAPGADARHFEIQSSAGYPGPLGQSPEGDRQADSTGARDESVRIAADAKLGPGDSRYDGQSPATERGGAAIYDVAPLDGGDEGNSEGSSLR